MAPPLAHVGGPLLGMEPSLVSSLPPTRRLPPLLIRQEFVLFPLSHHITVRAWATGQWLGNLSIDSKSTGDEVDEADTKVEATSTATVTCLTQTNDDIWVGATDGTIRCYRIARILQELQENSFSTVHPDTFHNCGNQPIRYLASIPNTSSRGAPHTTTILYAIIQGKTGKIDKSKSMGWRIEMQVVQLRITQEPQARTNITNNKDISDQQLLDTLVYSTKARPDRPDRSKLISLHVREMAPNQHLVIVARQATLQLYRVIVNNTLNSDTTTNTGTSSTQWNLFSTNFVSCLSLDESSLALGFASGIIHVWPLFVPTLWKYLQSKPTDSSSSPQTHNASSSLPCPKLVYRTLHWHVHPVATLAFDGAGILYSAGTEAVLCTWPLSSGTSAADRQKPTQVLPRLARAGISHIRTGHGQVLVSAEDETCQVFWLHNQARVWRIQAWPSGGPLTQAQAQVAWMQTDATAVNSTRDKLLIAGLPTTAGQIAWYAPHTQQVTDELVVAPWNTVSRTLASDKPWPPPLVTHAATAGSVLVTVDVAPTENILAGQAVALDKFNTVGSLTALKFWRANSTSNGINDNRGSDSSAPYVSSAIVPSPHGPASPVDAIALSPSGRFCCTVSCGEDKSFRIWQQITNSWVGRYRVAFPSGYSNQKVGAVCFSSDDSVLAMSFGTVITLWDVRRGALLTTLDHVGPSPIQSLSFLTSGPYQDSLVSFSVTGLVLQSPFGARGPVNFGWTWELAHTKVQLLSDVLVVDGETIAVALYDKVKVQSKIIVINVKLGRIRREVSFQQSSRIIAMAASAQSSESLYVMTLDGNLYRVSLSASASEPLLLADGETSTNHSKRRQGEAPVVAPLVDLAASSESGTKRKPSALVLTPRQSTGKRNRTSLLMEDEDEHTSTFVPRLRGAITLSFLGRNLQRKQG